MKNSNTKNMQIVKLILFILAIILLVLLAIKLFPFFINLGTPEGRIAFKEQIGNSFSGMLMLIGLQLLQILVPILPGEPIEFLAGMCFGTFLGMIIVFIGAFISSVIIFYCVRAFGKNFIVTFFGKDNLTKIENSKMFSVSNKVEIILFILFLIPGTPKDLFTYIAGLLPIKPSYFFLISTIARFPSIITSTFAGSNLADGNIMICVFAYIITFIISGIGLIIYKKMEKKHNAINEP